MRPPEASAGPSSSAGLADNSVSSGDAAGAGVSPGTIATRFHLGLGDALVTTAAQVATSAGINRIALSGGVMQNRFLHQHLWRGLGGLGFEVLSQSKVSANDGGISLGQAVVAAQSA